MPKKLHRRSAVFRKKKVTFTRVLIGLLVVVGCAGVLAGGYFTAKYSVEGWPWGDSSPSDVSTPPESTASEPSDTPSSSDPSSVPPQPEPQTGGLKAFYAPLSLLRDEAALGAQLDAAGAAGLNAVVFDLKDADGNLYYRSATELAAQSKAAAADALTLEQLRSAVDFMREKGFTALPRLYAFRDHVGAGELPTAKITVNGMSWYDGNPSNGGKRWLNPYAPDAHRYLIDMAAELKNLGVTGLMLDGVQFPEQESQADYGSSSLTSLGRGQVLQKFVTDLSAAFGDGQVILSMPGLAGFGEDTEVFGGNPLTFGETVAAPVLLPSALGNRLSVGENTVTDPAAHPYEAVQLAMSQLSLRVQLMEETARPAIMPWLQAYDYTAQQVRDQIRGVTEVSGDQAAYILYHPQGTYDFSSLS